MPQTKTHWQLAARCPFFAYESAQQHKIVCSEGPEEGMSLTVCFSGKDAGRQRYMREHCCKNYESCEIYGVCAKKWLE